MSHRETYDIDSNLSHFLILFLSIGGSCEVLPTSEGNWTYSQNYCASFDAFLVMIDSEEEMSFLRRYKGPADHWIGLQRMDNQEPWKWINDTIFNNCFALGGREKGRGNFNPLQNVSSHEQYNHYIHLGLHIKLNICHPNAMPCQLRGHAWSQYPLSLLSCSIATPAGGNH
uniref:C-type lectin domain-containing protein n=1 Tax=Podarcis muralis TaxID=64176 RepID=A0A670ITG4_PODMU